MASEFVVRLGDCEIRDWERFGQLSSTNQERVLQALIFELKKALEWNVWYAAKWWQEIYAAGVANLKKPFVKALYLSLRAKRLVDEGGRLVRRLRSLNCQKIGRAHV